ncbi:TetR/AcrR family transcriptional regulator [Streptococcus mutans]|uniref:TetR/AcrR family transcriptional regulator n=1 Tax=Streptococcus mutans TaxID=1309 RepID=UPI0002B4FBA2|nr:TetR/AcrR family transcriptional regulator [Streptococcus mutans]EMB51987.1 putative transcriptional regulator [Streptococcus mutans 1ID3]MCY7129049.1 TetR/AcrR family transcriptional regulator [Streptococcus mutans]OVF01110.1 TetR family transcriptional regulator [Streptococcus mutans]
MKRNTAQLKEKLIQTGVEEIKKNGLDQLSLRTIAKNCGVTHGTPYRHFKSKEDYLRVVLTRLSTFLNQEIAQGIDQKVSARDQLAQMGFNLITFTKRYPYFFEALFIKFPFKYMKITQETIVLDSDLPGFDKFKRIVFDLRKEENFTNSEAETLFHFWSFISGLAVLVNSPIGRDLDNQAIHTTINHMLDIYIKGEQT